MNKILIICITLSSIAIVNCDVDIGSKENKQSNFHIVEQDTYLCSKVWHDDSRNITCWSTGCSATISCLPDAQWQHQK